MGRDGEDGWPESAADDAIYHDCHSVPHLSIDRDGLKGVLLASRAITPPTKSEIWGLTEDCTGTRYLLHGERLNKTGRAGQADCLFGAPER